MPQRRVSDLPDKPYRVLALEAQRRGKELTDGLITVATDVILIGALDMIRELTERLDALEQSQGKPVKDA